MLCLPPLRGCVIFFRLLRPSDCIAVSSAKWEQVYNMSVYMWICPVLRITPLTVINPSAYPLSFVVSTFQLTIDHQSQAGERSISPNSQGTSPHSMFNKIFTLLCLLPSPSVVYSCVPFPLFPFFFFCFFLSFPRVEESFVP